MERTPVGAPAAGGRLRARDLGIVIGDLDAGPLDAITDVPGVRVGHATVRRPPDVHTGVTAVVPDGVGPGSPLPAGVFTGNGYGKLIGTTQVVELGELETPVLLTATLSAFRAADALVGWMLERPDCAGAVSLNPVVGECNDGFLSDIRARPVREEHVRAALDGASGGAVAEGCVGAGTGTGALGFKAGVGTASRLPEVAGRRYAVGALTQANFGGTLRVLGRVVTPGTLGLAADPAPAPETGSCVIVVATEAPLDARQLTRVARRAVFAIARTGAAYGHGSGDYAVAFGTRPAAGAPLPDAALGPLFDAVLDAVEESVLNSLLAATTTTGLGGRTLPALPPDRLLAVLDGGGGGPTGARHRGASRP